MANMTPPLHAQGRYVTKSPWELPGTLIYECIAIRTFEDVYKLGIDVYDTYYVPMGLVNSPTFNFSDEKTAKANIITLRGSDGSIVYIPDTYILSYPNAGTVKYQHVVLSVSLGAMPEYLDLAPLSRAIENMVSGRVGATVTVKEVVAPTNDQPTKENHEILEAARLGSITMYENDYTRLKKEEAKSALLQSKLTSALAILRANNLLPT